MRERKTHRDTRRKGFKATISDRDARPAPDLADRKIGTTGPLINLGFRDHLCTNMERFSLLAVVLGVSTGVPLVARDDGSSLYIDSA